MFFFIIRERKPCSFKSNSNYLVTSMTCVDFDIEDTYCIKDDIKYSSWACRKAKDLFDTSSKKLWSSAAHVWLTCIAIICSYANYTCPPIAHTSYFRWLGNLKCPLNKTFRATVKVCNLSISYGIAPATDTSRHCNTFRSDILLALLKKENK